MSNKEEKLNEVIAFIQANPGQSNNWYATHNGVVSRATFFRMLSNKEVETTCETTPVNEKLCTVKEELISKGKQVCYDYEELYADYEHLHKALTYKNEEIERLRELLNESKNEDKEYSVYIHLIPNNTIYIGQTRQDLNARWGYGSGYRKNSLFYLNIKKYGWDNIDHLLVKGGLSKKEADNLETTLINFYSSNEISTGRVVLNIKENENK